MITNGTFGESAIRAARRGHGDVGLGRYNSLHIAYPSEGQVDKTMRDKASLSTCHFDHSEFEDP